MKPAAFDYAAPRTLAAALDLLAANADGARLLAGGQSLVPVLNLRMANPALLIDLNRVPELAGIRHEDGALVIGAMTRHRAIETSSLVAQSHPLLPHAISFIAHTQIRNRGTIGGSLCHADPAAEWPALCIACDAQMTIAGPRGQRTLPAQDFSLGVYTTALDEGEILTSLRFPAWPAGRRWGFQELSRRHGDFAIVGVACLLDLDANGLCTAARIVIFGASDTPVLATDAAQALAGRRPDADAIAAAARCARSALQPRADHHASAEYRSDLVEVLTRRALAQAAASNLKEMK